MINGIHLDMKVWRYCSDEVERRLHHMVNTSWSIRRTPDPLVEPLLYLGARFLSEEKADPVAILGNYAQNHLGVSGDNFLETVQLLYPPCPAFVNYHYSRRNPNGIWREFYRPEELFGQLMRKWTRRNLVKRLEESQRRTEKFYRQVKKWRGTKHEPRWTAWLLAARSQQIRLETVSHYWDLFETGRCRPLHALAERVAELQREWQVLQSHFCSKASAVDDARARFCPGKFLIGLHKSIF